MPKKTSDEDSQPSGSVEAESDSEDEVFKPRRATRSKGTAKHTTTSQSVVTTTSNRRSSRARNKTEAEAQQNEESTKQPPVSQNQQIDKSTTQPPVSQDEIQNVKVRKTKLKAIDKDKSEEKKRSQSDIPKAFDFCPICQVPLRLLKISAAMHTASCNISGKLSPCLDGLSCLNSSIFHYRDHSHEALALFRDSEDFVEPDIIFTPQKAKVKRTPLKSSGGKKRPSKSPVVSASKVPKREEPCCSKDLPSTPGPSSPDMFAAGAPADRKKKLSFSEDPDDPEVQGDRSMSPPEVSANGADSQPVSEIPVCSPLGEQCSELPDSITQQSSLWCSDLVLSGVTPIEDDMPESVSAPSVNGNGAMLCTVKTEPESQHSEDMDVAAPLASASNANIVVEYSNTTEENSVTGSRVECSEICRIEQSESLDVLQANCSVVFKAKGVNRAEAMARSPMSVTLMVNNLGWQALEIKGTETSSVQKIDVSLCLCGHAVCVQCCMNDRDVQNDVKFNPENLKQREIFFATMTDMGLRDEPFYVNFSNTKKHMENTCNQITVSSAAENVDFSSNVSENGSVRNGSAQPQEVNVMDEERNTPIQRDAFALLRKTSKQGKQRPGTPSSLSSSSNSRASTPTPGSMVVANSTGSSWTLVPAVGKQSAGTGTGDGARARATGWGRGIGKKLPAYKRIPDTQFVVDAFNYGIIPGVKVYFLSHFHSDHYMGLGKNFDMPIYCSKVTANLVQLKLRVASQYLHVLKVGEPRVVCGVEVEVFDAFHCPGAVMFLFRLLDGRVFLHVGDFRAHPSMEEYPQLRLVDKLYLDTTYCDPAYDFPSQEEVVHKVIQTVREHLSKNKSTLFVSGTYTIGKEKVFMGIAEEFDLKIWTTGEKRRILECLEDNKLSNCLTTNPSEAQVHVLAMRDIALEELLKHLGKYSSKFSSVVGFKPTGWQTSTSLKGKPSDFQKSTRGKATIYGVPYSEHSSYSELRRFVRYIKPKDIQVTVNVGKSAQYRKTFQQWLSNAGDSQPKMMQYFSKE